MVLLTALLLKWCVLLLLYWSFRYIVVLLIGCVLLMLCVLFTLYSGDAYSVAA